MIRETGRESTAISPPLRKTTEISLVIEGMTCGACAARIERGLNALDGVKARVNYATPGLQQ
jgi:hypothetical protein